MTFRTKIGIGLAALGRPKYNNIRKNEPTDKSEKVFRENAFKVLDFTYEKGIHYFDTAPSFGKGERFLMDWNNERKYLFDSFQITYNIFEQSTFEVLNILKLKDKNIIIKEVLANGRVFNKSSYFSDLVQFYKAQK